ncbi:hypothetical protein LC065_12875 [Halobacillus litoralis]|uniref:hypothetical protein n=1 Tax=Halobacillus litoralis TaxID=45668 RepID=UPI001CFE1708|nr:hypothetical protein [Halobacillus litoralis]WLR46464.1 hypothetical protein LC065_12875 [Halobacillus litoralis]
MSALFLVIGLLGLIAYVYFTRRSFFSDERNVKLWIMLFVFLPLVVMGLCISLSF